jgi:hypothetical protein
MRKRLKNLKNKSGHSENGAPRQMLDEALYRERQSGIPFDSEYSGWSNGSRPRDQAISLRTRAGTRGPDGPTPPPTLLVDLGSAGFFAIFAQSGITTTGGSTVNGDMGINPAAAASITGFALALDGGGQFSTSSQVFPGTPALPYPPQLGQVFAPDYAVPTPAKVVLASADLITAYNDAAGRVPNFTAAGADIGGLTLEAGVAGVYKYTGASSVTSAPLTLHGTNPGDAIIIQVAGTFDVHQNIVLTGTLAGHPENVYFAVAGQVTIFGGVTINGEFLGATGIAMQAGSVLNGRALAQTAVTLISNTINET